VPSCLIVQSILELSNALREEKELRYRQIKKPTDSKIKTLVQEQIVQALERKTGALFPSATAPRVVIGLLSSLHSPKKTIEERIRLIPPKSRAPRISCRAPPSKRVPIGLNRCEPYNWMSSLIQFLLFLPGSWDLFSLIPRSFQPLREFADQYFTDQEENRPVSSADTTELIRCLMSKLPIHFLNRKPILYEILHEWMKAIFPHCPFDLPGEIHPVVLHQEWHIVSRSPNDDDLQEAFQKKISEGPPEILIGFKGAPCPLKGHYFAASEGISYNLDSFIEIRPDGDDGEHYITYLKRDGSWYQCDEERVIQFRSNYLNVPLRRATLLHYKRVGLAGRNPGH
jgi:hypothetical protein